MIKKFLVLFLPLVLLSSCAPPSSTISPDTGNVGINTFNTLLGKYVSDGEVDYITWKKEDFDIFDKYIISLSDVSLEGLAQDERKAFWINAYNALTIHAVLKRIPSNNLLAKAFSVQMLPGFFDGITYKVAGEQLTLNDIENIKLREAFKDSRTHFVIVCASRSCPLIQNTVFMAEGLNERLNNLARSFIQNKKRNRMDKEKNILYLSQIFNWYGEDFVKDSGSVIGYVKKYLDEKDAEYLNDNDVTIKYLYYDWLVNIKR